MSIASEISRIVSLRNEIRTKLISLGVLSDSSADLGAIRTGINGISGKSSETFTPGATDQTIAPGSYLTGAQTIKGDANLIAANIRAGVTIFGITGTYAGRVISAENGVITYDNSEGIVSAENGVVTIVSAENGVITFNS